MKDKPKTDTDMRNKKVRCVRGLKDILTVDKIYVVLDANSACYKVRADHNRRRYYDKDRFEVCD